MTDFQYLNERRIQELADQFFGERGDVYKITGMDMVKVYKYLIAYCSKNRQRINAVPYQVVKYIAIDSNYTKENLVFFEKVEHCDDVIYFEQYMRSMEEDKVFLDAWHLWFEKAS